jgi:hypothetical protein
MLRRLVLAPLLFALASAAAARMPAPFVAEYDLTRGVLAVGTLTSTLELDDTAGYRYESRMETGGLVALFHHERVVETSRGQVRDLRFQPEHYEYASVRGKRDHALRFDRDAGIVSRADEGSDWSAPLADGLLDKVAWQLQIMIDMDAAPAALDYDIADRDEIKHYHIRNLGAEDLSTPAGGFSTVKLERANPGSTRRTTVWVAAALDWLPVKVEYRDKDGAVTTAVLREVQRR